MAKGTLLANARTTKKSGSSASLKSGKSAIISEPVVAPASKKAKKSSSGAASAHPSSDDVVQVDRHGNEHRKLKVNDAKYSKHHKTIVKESLEGMELLHCDEQSKVETILKMFDLSAEYGPAVGMTRLDRWKRAASWGLDPPEEVYDILTTVEGEKELRYRESLFDGLI